MSHEVRLPFPLGHLVGPYGALREAGDSAGKACCVRVPHGGQACTAAHPNRQKITRFGEGGRYSNAAEPLRARITGENRQVSKIIFLTRVG